MPNFKDKDDRLCEIQTSVVNNFVDIIYGRSLISRALQENLLHRFMNNSIVPNWRRRGGIAAWGPRFNETFKLGQDRLGWIEEGLDDVAISPSCVCLCVDYAWIPRKSFVTLRCHLWGKGKNMAPFVSVA